MLPFSPSVQWLPRVLADAGISANARSARAMELLGTDASLALRIADDLQLAELGLGGGVDACRHELSLLLSRYSLAPFVHGWADIAFDVT